MPESQNGLDPPEAPGAQLRPDIEAMKPLVSSPNTFNILPNPKRKLMFKGSM